MSMYKAEWLEEDRERVLKMERLYVLDGRHHKANCMHGLYTGLAEKEKEIEDRYK